MPPGHLSAAAQFTGGINPSPTNKSEQQRTRAQHTYYTTFHMFKSILIMHKSCIITLCGLRIDETLGLCYSIVTERKQPEIRR